MSPLALRRTGLALTVLVGLFLAMDAGGKLFAPEMMIANSPRSACPPIPRFTGCSARSSRSASRST